uniref:Uncharacterized protein n=1 Tax=Avena sativa TaxID=4498 RepID=A0ACD5ZN89_AVESA
MANYHCNPLAFVPTGLAIDNGPQGHRVRADLAVSAEAPLNHDNFAIAETDVQVPIQQRYHARIELRRRLNRQGFHVSSMEDYPIGLGLFSFANSFVRDRVVGRSYTIDDWIGITFVKHDEGLNMRVASFCSEKWVMFLNFPLDYQTEYWIEKAVSLFGKLQIWYNISEEDHACILVKVWIMKDALVPKSLVLRQMGGHRRAWAVPVYLLRSDQWNAHMHIIPEDTEDEPPADGEPHPFYGAHTSAEQRFQQRFQGWLQRNGIFAQGNGNNVANNGRTIHRDVSDSVRRNLEFDNSNSAPLMILPSRGQVNYQAIAREHGGTLFCWSSSFSQ